MWHFDLRRWGRKGTPTPTIHLRDRRDSTSPPQPKPLRPPNFTMEVTSAKSLSTTFERIAHAFAITSVKKMEETRMVLSPMKCLPTRLHYARHVRHMDKWHIFHPVNISFNVYSLESYALLFPPSPSTVTFSKHHCLLTPQNFNFCIFIHMLGGCTFH